MSIHEALQNFAAAVTEKMAQVALGEAEDQVRGPFETFMAEAARALGWRVVCTGETPLPDQIGRPDYAVHRARALARRIRRTQSPWRRRDCHPVSGPQSRSVQTL